MKLTTILSLTLTTGALADPPTNYKKGHKLTDGDILNYALTLEHLEDKFYREGLKNYTHNDFIKAGFPDPFYANLKEISSDESKHVAFLTSALKAAKVKPVPECTYRFPSTNARSFVALSSVLEGVGVSAYLGAAADIASDAYLTAAGSILTIESRHSAYIRAALAQKPFPAPFDTPLDPNEVHSLAHGFIHSCPAGTPPLPVKAFPALTLATTGSIKAGTVITVKTPGYTLKAKDSRVGIYGAFMTATGPAFVAVKAVYGGFTLVVPKSVAGQSYFVIINCKDRVNDDTILAGPAIVEVKS